MIYNVDPHHRIAEKAHVIIEDSSELRDMHMEEFIGMEGMVVSLVRRQKRNSGAFVRILGGQYDKQEWFFPLLAMRDLDARSLEDEFGEFII